MAGEVDGDCRKCSRSQRVARGCVRETDQPQYWSRIPGYDEPIKRCPMAIVPKSMKRVVQFSSLVSAHGVWPVAGGAGEQANWFFEAAHIACDALSKARDHGKS